LTLEGYARLEAFFEMGYRTYLKKWILVQNQGGREE